MSDMPQEPPFDDDEMVEIDLDVLDATIELWHETGLDVADNEAVFAHASALLAMVLRRLHDEGKADEEDLATVAAEAAAFAVEAALGEEELPALVVPGEVTEN